MLRRGGTKKIARYFGVPPLLNTKTLGGGGSPEKKTKNHSITAKAFSYIRTEFGAPRSRRVGVKFATN